MSYRRRRNVTLDSRVERPGMLSSFVPSPYRSLPRPPRIQPPVVPPVSPLLHTMYLPRPQVTDLAQLNITSPYYNEIIALIRQIQSLHINLMEYQRQTIQSIQELNEVLEHGVHDRQHEVERIEARVDALQYRLSQFGII